MDDVTDMHEIEQAARRLIERFGMNAPAEVEKRIAELRHAGEAEAVARWNLIARNVRALLGPTVKAC